MTSHRDLLKRDDKENKCLSDLLRINFKEGHFLANSGKNICTVPFQCMEELLSSMQLIQVKDHDKNHYNQTLNTQFRHSDAYSNFQNHKNKQIVYKQPQEYNQSTPIKVGQIFYIQFYFSKQYIYYDSHNNKLILSRDKHTAFKIIEHISKTSATHQQQTVDFIGNIVPNQNRYLIVIANELLYLKYADHSVYMGTYDEKCILTFSHSIFKSDKKGQNLPLLNSPCRLYSVQQEKYVVFDIKNRQVLLKQESVCIQGMCSIETVDFYVNQLQSPTMPFHRKKSRIIPQKKIEQSNQVAIRVLQGSNRYFLAHNNTSTQKLAQDLGKMLHPMEERLNNSHTFLLRFQPSFTQQYRPQTTFNLSNISNISMAGPLNLVEEEEKEEIIEQLTIREINLKLNIDVKEQLSFLVQFYPSYNGQYQLFIYDSMVSKERVRGREVLREKQLYLDYRQIVGSGKQLCVLKEYSSQKMKRQSPKFKNILRVQFITREMLTPFLHYYSLLLNLKVYHYHRQPNNVGVRGSEQRLKMRLNLQEIQEILAECFSSLQVLAEVDKEKTECLMRQLLQINFIGILQELLQAIIAKKQDEEREEGFREKDFRQYYPYETIQSTKIMSKLLLFIGKTMPDRLIDAILKTNNCLLFMRLCKFPQMNSFFSKVQLNCIDDPQQMVKKLEKVIDRAQEDGKSICRNICILWAFRIMKKHQLQNDTIQTLSQRLIQSYKRKLTEEYLIVLQLIKVSRGEHFYSREVVKFLPLQRLQQQQIPYSLRQAYFRRIIQNYQDGIRLPFRPKLFFIGKSAASLEQDNQRILHNYLQEVLPKNSKFQTIQNKMFALLFVELYLCFGGDLLGEVTVEQLSCRDYLPQLIVLLQEQLQNYIYEQQHEARFVMQLLKCLQLALQKEIKYIIYEENELCFEDEELIMKNCLQQYGKIIVKKVAHATTRNSLQQRDSIKSKQQRTSKAQRLLNLFLKEKPTVSGGITQPIDKQIIWKQINDPNNLTAEQKLNIFEGVLNVATLLLSPSLRFRQYYHKLIANPYNLSLHFIAVVQMIANKTYQHDLWNLVQRLQQRFSEDEWRAIIAIINSNQLLTHFILFPRYQKPTQRQLATLYRVLNQLLLSYLEWTNSRIAVDYSRNENYQNYVQIQTNHHHYPNDLEPDNFIYLLSQVQPSYLIEQMTLHQTLVCSMGTITNLAFYYFYSQYIVRYQCQHFQNSIINLSLVFMNALTAPLRTQFANNFQYSLFKQSSQLKNLISQLYGVRENIDNTPQRATNFNILTQLKDERVSRLTFSSEESEKEFLIGLFRLLAEVQTHSTTHKQILPKLGYPVIITVLGRYSGQILLKHEISKFLLSSIEKQMAYGLNKYLKRGKQDASQGQDQEQDSEEYAILLEFVKQSNYLLQRETQAFKGLKLTEQHSAIFVSYASTLLSIVRIRDNILSYLKFQRTQRIQRSNSDLSDAPSLTSRSISSQESSLISSSIVAREQQAAARVRQMMFHYNALHIDESQVENIEGINKLLCYQVIQGLDGLARTTKLPPSLQKPLHWVQTYYKICLTNQSRLENEAIPRKELLYKLDKSYLTPKIHTQVHRMTRNTFIEQGSVTEAQTTAPNYESINHFLSLNVEGYLVLLIELLQRYMLILQKTKSIEYDGQIMHLMILIETDLIEQIRLYKLEDQQFGKQDFEVLPQQYYKRFGHQSEQDQREEKQHQKCCDLPEKKLESLFELLLIAHRLDKPIFLLYLLNILERTAFYNITNQTTLQRIIYNHFQSFYQLVFAIIYRFRTLSPILDNSFFTVAKLLDPEFISQQKVYYRKSGQQRDEGWVQGLRGMQGFHLASLNYYMLVNMLLACSRSLNFQFKSLFARPTIERESILSEIIDVLSIVLRNFSPTTQEKMEFTRISLKMVNTFLRGPVQPNIQIALNRNYSRFLVQLLDIANKSIVQGMLMVYLLKIKRLIAEGMFILIPFIRLPDKELRSCEDGLRQSYIRSKKAYNGQFDNIISDYVQKKESNDLALLYFQLALNFYYCLIQIYAQRGNNRIMDVQVQLLARQRREKRRRKNWMVFYQIYEVIVAIVEPIYRRLRGTYEELTDERSEEQLLRRAIVFFTKHVSQVQVKVYGKIKKISFLLPQQGSCYNVSIRKEFYRLIGKEQRQLRLNKFMKISKYIIIRLQISKAVRRVLSHFKPLQVIVQNRQLWKSLCFLNALLLNMLFIFTDTFNNIDSTLFLNTRYAILAITFLFIIFLYLIYFLEVLPLKLKVYSILRRRGFTMSSLLIFIKDKTLGFALFYTVFLGLSFFMLGFVSVLLFDYLFRFKVSSKITFLMFRSIPKIFYVIILLFMMLYVVALLTIRLQQRIDSCIDVASCTQSLFFIFMNLRFNIQLPYQNEGVFPLVMVLLRMFTKIIMLSLLVGIIFMEKRKDDQQAQAQLLQVRDVCFICGGQRNAIEKARNSNKGFDTHVEMEHNLWNYIYYLVYLKNKQRKNLNAIQGMIIEQWDANQIDWLPDSFL